MTYVFDDWPTVIAIALTLGWLTTKIRRRIVNDIHNRAIKRKLDHIFDRDVCQDGNRAQER